MPMRDIPKKRMYDAARKRNRTKMLHEIKLTRGCKDCGYRAHAEALEFDHLGNKEFSISWGRTNNWEKVLLEIAKCDVVCANCHRIRTANRRALIQGRSPLPTELSVK